MKIKYVAKKSKRKEENLKENQSNFLNIAQIHSIHSINSFRIHLRKFNPEKRTTQNMYT